MTEAEWLSCANPKAMLEFLRGRGTDRQFRLFNCACVRRVWEDLKDERLRGAVHAAERHADGLLGCDALGRAVTEANRARGKHDVTRAAYETVRYEPGGPFHATSLVIDRVSWHVASSVVPDPQAPWGRYEGDTYVPIKPEAQKAWVAARGTELTAHCRIVRDIFGNPFRPFHPVTADALWLTPAVADLARSIYDDRTFDRLPELADALEAAGCEDGQMLGHCRSGGEHVRGCWALDLVLRRP